MSDESVIFILSAAAAGSRDTMAIHFCASYRNRQSRNFGDDINPVLLGKLFLPSIIHSKNVCVHGIGTILTDWDVDAVSHYERKIVFSSGVRGGHLNRQFDESWDFVCVRGPLSVQALHLPDEKAICDGAVLLADFYPPYPEQNRDGIVFIPHISTGLSCGLGLQEICRDLRYRYLPPDSDSELFIQTVRGARLVIAEAMHGAILADALRTPWIALSIKNYDPFKWSDWFASMQLPDLIHRISASFWDFNSVDWRSVLKASVHRAKILRVKHLLRRIVANAKPVLSQDEVIEARKSALREKVKLINEKYG